MHVYVISSYLYLTIMEISCMYIFVISIHFKIATSKNLENGVDDLPYLVSYLYEHASISPYSFCHAALIKDSKNACMLGVFYCKNCSEVR